MAELIVVSGPPGAGKSTVARILVRGFPTSALVPGDDFFAFAHALLRCGTPEEECVARVATRVGHGFTDETATRRMHREFSRGHLDARHLLVDPPADAGGTAGIVLDRLRAGALRHEI